MEIYATSKLSALSHPHRLAIFRLLVRRYPHEVPAGEIAAVLSFKPNTTSTYLSALLDSDLVLQRRQGTSLLYRANLESAESLIRFLFSDCCRSRPNLCDVDALPDPIRPKEKPDGKYSVLFVCSGNSARSIFAEAIMRHQAGDKFDVYSAGARPLPQINPYALDMLKARGMQTASLRPKSLAEFQGAAAPSFDFVFTVCDLAANEDCPTWSGQPVSAHWGLPDPVKVTGTEAEKRLAFQQTFGAIANRIKAFASLPFEALDRASLQKCVDEIGKTPETI